jgi:DNA repair exonuclease SbcCD ATPase subunit
MIADMRRHNTELQAKSDKIETEAVERLQQLHKQNEDLSRHVQQLQSQRQPTTAVGSTTLQELQAELARVRAEREQWKKRYYDTVQNLASFNFDGQANPAKEVEELTATLQEYSSQISRLTADLQKREKLLETARKEIETLKWALDQAHGDPMGSVQRRTWTESRRIPRVRERRSRRRVRRRNRRRIPGRIETTAVQLRRGAGRKRQCWRYW